MMGRSTLQPLVTGALVAAAVVFAVGEVRGQQTTAGPDKPEIFFVPGGSPGEVINRGFDPGDTPSPAPGDPAALYGFRAKARALSPDAPPDHLGDYLARHRVAAKANPSSCSSCHTERSCLECHGSPVRLAPLHPPGYTAYHGIDARKDASSCATCHAPQTFCRDCHQLAKAGNVGSSAPPPGVRFHPADWTEAGASPTRHGREARANLNTCTSCHAERDCATCHVNVNPHPPTFVAKCGRLLRLNPRMCATCHVDVRRVEAICR